MTARIAAIVAAVAILVGGMVALSLRSTGRSPPGPGDVRIVVLSPALAITLADLGLENRIVGRHGYDYVLDKAIPVCGDQAGIDYEALLAARPTHVLLEWGAERDLPRRLRAMADEHDWTVENFQLLSLEQIAASVRRLSGMFGVSPRDEALRGAAHKTDEQIVEAMLAPARDAGRTHDGRVLLMWPTNPPAAVGPGSWHHELLLRLGATPAIESGAAYIELDAEDVLEMAPDAVVLIAPRELSWEQTRDLLGPVAGLPIPAVENGRVGVIDHPLVLTPSTAVVDYARELAEILASW